MGISKGCLAAILVLCMTLKAFGHPPVLEIVKRLRGQAATQQPKHVATEAQESAADSTQGQRDAQMGAAAKAEFQGSTVEGGGSGVTTYQGGMVLSSPIKLYLVFCGEWMEDARAAVRNFVGSISDPSLGHQPGTVPDWWSLTHLYTDRLSRPVTSHVFLAGEAVLGAPEKVLLPDTVNGHLLTLIDSGMLPQDGDGVYAFLTTPEVVVAAEGGNPCSWHQATSIKYLWAGTPQAGSSCGQDLPEGLQYPHGSDGLDVLISSLARQLVQTATSPYKMSWKTKSGLGSVDACSLRPWGGELSSSGGVAYNAVGTGGSKYLLPQIQNPRTSACATGSSPPSGTAPQPGSATSAPAEPTAVQADSAAASTEYASAKVALSEGAVGMPMSAETADSLAANHATTTASSSSFDSSSDAFYDVNEEGGAEGAASADGAAKGTAASPGGGAEEPEFAGVGEPLASSSSTATREDADVSTSKAASTGEEGSGKHSEGGSGGPGVDVLSLGSSAKVKDKFPETYAATEMGEDFPRPYAASADTRDDVAASGAVQHAASQPEHRAASIAASQHAVKRKPHVLPAKDVTVDPYVGRSQNLEWARENAGR